MSGKKLKANDAYSNPASKIGYGQADVLQYGHSVDTHLTWDWMELNRLYTANWVVDRVINVFAEDMTKNWYFFKSQMPPAAIDKIARAERLINLRRQITEGVMWARLYGGSAAIMLIDGQEDYLDQPLDLDTVMPGSFRGLLVLDRWNGVSPGIELEQEFGAAMGRPEFYHVTTETDMIRKKVHHTRVCVFRNRQLPRYLELRESYWGISEIEVLYEALSQQNDVYLNAARLVTQANLKTLKLDGFDMQAAIGTEDVLRDLYKTVSAMNSLLNSFGMPIIGAGDSLETHQYAMSGLADVIDRFQMLIAGAARMPVTLLFGRSPAGMNATGDADFANYYGTIKMEQERVLRPIFNQILPVLMMSTFGMVPDDLDFDFNDIGEPDDEKKINYAEKGSIIYANLFNSGLISQKTALEGLRNIADKTGLFTEITDEVIASASEDLVGSAESFPEMPSFEQIARRQEFQQVDPPDGGGE